jgi:hypothetical protein
VNLISYLNMHRSRLGYVNCVLLVADTQLDTLASLRRRLDNLLYHPVSVQESIFTDFRTLIEDRAWEEFQKSLHQRGKRNSKKPRQGLLHDIHLEDADQVTYDVADLWLYQASMRSRVGRVLRDYSDNSIGLSQDLNFLSQGYALTELGNLAKILVMEQVKDESPKSPFPNPLVIYDDPRLRLIYFYSLLLADIGFLAILEAVSGGSPPNKALLEGLDYLLKRVGDEARFDEVGQVRHILSLRKRMEKPAFTKQGGEEEPVEKGQTVPRLEFCVDLGLLERFHGSTEEGSRYKLTEATRAIPIALKELIQHPKATQQWLDQQFFGACGLLYNHDLRPISNPDQRLLYFAKGARLVGRRLGFIPGRIAALAGSLSAWVDGVRLELAEVFEEVYCVPRGPWSDYIKFSGGSRLDSEFLVTVESTLEAKLQQAINASRAT